MSSVVISGNTSGTITLDAPAVAGTTTLTLPATSGTVIVNSGAQTIEFADGSAGAPSITNSGDTNTGIFFSAADTIDFAEGGVACGQFDSSANFKFNSGYGSVATAYGCRAWVNFNGTGTVAIRASGNVTSITDNNVGSYTINFTTALVDANYSVSGIPRNTQSYAQIQVLAIGIAQATAPTTSALAITVTGQNDGAVRTAIDSDYVCLSVFR